MEATSIDKERVPLEMTSGQPRGTVFLCRVLTALLASFFDALGCLTHDVMSKCLPSCVSCMTERALVGKSSGLTTSQAAR
jgi:hypothetical protein